MSTNTSMEFVDSWILMSTPVIPILLLVTYLMIVLKIGPNYMKDKKPYQLKYIVTVYNIAQVFISIFLMYISGRIIRIHGIIPETCAMETEESRHDIAAVMHYYLLAKVTELLDTIFFVLRKKDRQISFLHVYHHTLMIFVTWTALKFEPSVHLIFLALINSFIHVIMYSYYCLSSFPALTRYLWWKKYITRLQLVQFAMVMTQFLIAAKVSECSPSYILSTSLFFNGFLFLYLFGSFYFNNYTKSNAKKDGIVRNANGSVQDCSNIKNKNNDRRDVKIDYDKGFNGLKFFNFIVCDNMNKSEIRKQQ